MTAVLPESVPADGNLKVAWVPSIADLANVSAATDLAGAGVVDLTCYMPADGFTPGGDEQTINDPRLCSRQDFERPGRFSDTLDIGYVYQGQDSAAADNAAFTTLTHLTEGFIVVRWGTDYEAAFAADDVVDIYPAQCGVQRKQPGEANSVLRVNQKIFITGSVKRDVVVVA